MRNASLAISIAVLLGVIGPVQAQGDDPLIDSNVLLELGGFLISSETEVRLDGEFSTGTEIDLERDLGLEDADRFRFDGLWRITPRHHLRGAYYALDRDAERRIDRELEFGDIVIPVQGEVSANVDTSIAQLSYEYAFARGDRYEIAGSFGVHWISFDLGVSASLFGGSFTREESADTDAPLPVIGLRGLWRVGGKFYLSGTAQYFDASYDKYDGNLQDYRVALIWMPWRHFGFGAGYNFFQVDVDVDEERFDGSLRWRYDGAVAFAEISF